MSPLVRNIILNAAATALILGTVRAVAALPHLMHGAGMVAPHTWEELIVESLEATGQ